MNSTSISLLHRLQQTEDSENWNRLVDLYAPLLRAWLRKYEVQDSDADDLVQRTLRQILVPGDFGDPSDLRHQLHQPAHIRFAHAKSFADIADARRREAAIAGDPFLWIRARICRLTKTSDNDHLFFPGSLIRTGLSV